MASVKEKRLNALLAQLARDDTRDELEELIASPPAPPDFLDRSFPEQCAFIEDPSRLKVQLCTRRSGKSYGYGLYMFKTAYENPRCTVIYLALTRQSAKNVMWKDVLEEINNKFKLGAKPNLSELSWTLPNGSVIYLLGVDSNEKEMRKAFGQKFKLAVVDEAGLYTVDLSKLVYSLLQPATADQSGTICLTGTPSNLKRGLFYNLTTELHDDRGEKFVFEWDATSEVDGRKRRWGVIDKENGAQWSGHFWTANENPHMRKQWAEEIATKLALNPRIEETPLFKQEYLGEWVVDSDKFVYKFDYDRNTYQELPPHPAGGWHHVLGVDLGYEDDSAFCVIAYHDHDPTAYVVETWSAKKLDITLVAGYIHEYAERYDFDAIVVDGSNKMAVEEMRKRHDLPFIDSVQKRYKVGENRRAKANMIEVMNADFILGRIKVHPENCESLIAEYENLIWDDRERRGPLAPRQEHPSCPNHNADSALYAWMSVYTYLSEAQKELPAKGSVDRMALELEERIEREAEMLDHARRESINAALDDFEQGYTTIIDVTGF